MIIPNSDLIHFYDIIFAKTMNSLSFACLLKLGQYLQTHIICVSINWRILKSLF